jgi:hypothetical protein
MLMTLPGSCLIWMSLLRHHGLALRERCGLADDRRGADGDGQVAVRNGAGPQRTAWLSTMEPVRALMTTLAAGGGFERHLHSAMKHARAGVVGRAHLHRAAVQGLAVPSPSAALMACATRGGLEVGRSGPA